MSGLDLMGAIDVISNKEAIIKWVYSLQIVSCAARHAAQAAICEVETSVPASRTFPVLAPVVVTEMYNCLLAATFQRSLLAVTTREARRQ